MNRLWLVILMLGLLVLGARYWLASTTPVVVTTQTPTATLPAVQDQGDVERIEYTARFVVFTNGTFRVFTLPMYHHLSDEVFIATGEPNVVQVRRAGVTWGDFFATLPMEVTAECLTTGTGERFCSGGAGELQFYVNGERDQGALGRVIENGDQLLVSYGDENADEIEEQLERLREL